ANGVVRADSVQCHALNYSLLEHMTLGRVSMGEDRVRRRQAGSFHFKKPGRAWLVSHGDAQVDVVWAILDQAVIPTLHGLNVDALPAALIKGFGDRVVDGILRADVDIKAALHLFQRTPQKDIFAILCIGDKRTLKHGRGVTQGRRRARRTLSQNWSRDPLVGPHTGRNHAAPLY